MTAKQLLNPDVYKDSQETVNLDKNDVKPETEQVKADAEKPAEKVETDKVDTDKEEKAEEKTEEKEEVKEESKSAEADTGTSLLLKRIDELEKMYAQAQASATELRTQVQGKSQELNRVHNLNLLEKKSKEELSREIVNLRERITTSEKQRWETFNKWLPKQAEKVQKFVAVIKTDKSTPDELVMKINEAVENGLLGNDAVDNSFAVKPTVKSNSKRTQARQLYDTSNVSSVAIGLNNPQKT